MASDGDGDSLWTRPGTVLAIAFLLVAVVGGAIALYRTHPAGTAALAAVPSVSAPAVTAAASPAPSTATAATGAPVSAAATPTASALPDQTVPVTAPPATWETVATLSLPTSPFYGPKVNVNGTVLTGYQHSPTGALFAAADNRARYAAVADWRTATLSAVANTPGRAAFLVIRQADGVVVPTPGEFTQLAGFTFLSYTPAEAVMQFLNVGSDGTLVVTVNTVIWQDNDWKVLLPPSGDPAPGTQAQSTAGFIPWKDNR